MKVESWTVPKIWEGGECFVLGGGPSVNNLDLPRLHDKRVIAVNNSYQLGPWDVLFYGDCRWRELHTQGLADFTGLKVHGCPHAEGIGDIKRVHRHHTPYGIDRRPNELCWNRSSGACAINLAVHFGVKRIVLLGFDMRKVDGETNYHRDHPKHRMKSSKVPYPYPSFLEPFPVIARDLKRLKVECVNATPGSALDVFPIVEPDEVM